MLGMGHWEILMILVVVLLLFGAYKGSVLKSGFFWVNPFFSKKKIGVRTRI